MYFADPSTACRSWQKINFWKEYCQFEFMVFLLLDWLPNQDWRTHSVLLFTHGWIENNRMYAFSKCINGIWNAKKLVQDLNLGR